MGAGNGGSESESACQNQRVNQITRVVRLQPSEQRGLRERLAEEEFEFRTVPHARFSVKGPGIVATLYDSGKFVVQGEDPDLFLERFLPAHAAAKASEQGTAGGPAQRSADRTLIGSDECGKGDYFGPLVVAAVRREPPVGE